MRGTSTKAGFRRPRGMNSCRRAMWRTSCATRCAGPWTCRRSCRPRGGGATRPAILSWHDGGAAAVWLQPRRLLEPATGPSPGMQKSGPADRAEDGGPPERAQRNTDPDSSVTPTRTAASCPRVTGSSPAATHRWQSMRRTKSSSRIVWSPMAPTWAGWFRWSMPSMTSATSKSYHVDGCDQRQPPGPKRPPPTGLGSAAG